MSAAMPPPDCSEVTLRAGSLALNAFLGVPQEAKGIVVFAHGSGSGRMSPRNNYVAGRLRDGNVGGNFQQVLQDLHFLTQVRMINLELHLKQL